MSSVLLNWLQPNPVNGFTFLHTITKPTKQMMKPLLLILLLSSSLLMGCLDAAEGDAVARHDERAGLAGPDEDQDGVRDDIGEYINASFRNEAQRQAALQAARVMQEVFTLDLAQPLEVRAVNRKLARADHCLYLAFEQGNDTKPAAQVSSELEAMATDTSERLKHYLAFNRALDGALWATPRVNTCD